MTEWSGRPAPCRGKSGIVGRAGTRGTRRRTCAAQGASGLAGVEDRAARRPHPRRGGVPRLRRGRRVHPGLRAAARCDRRTCGVPGQSTVSWRAGHPGGCSSTTTAPTAAFPCGGRSLRCGAPCCAGRWPRTSAARPSAARRPPRRTRADTAVLVQVPAHTLQRHPLPPADPRQRLTRPEPHPHLLELLLGHPERPHRTSTSAKIRPRWCVGPLSPPIFGLSMRATGPAVEAAGLPAGRPRPQSPTLTSARVGRPSAGTPPARPDLNAGGYSPEGAARAERGDVQGAAAQVGVSAASVVRTASATPAAKRVYPPMSDRPCTCRATAWMRSAPTVIVSNSAQSPVTGPAAVRSVAGHSSTAVAVPWPAGTPTSRTGRRRRPRRPAQRGCGTSRRPRTPGSRLAVSLGSLTFQVTDTTAYGSALGITARAADLAGAVFDR